MEEKSLKKRIADGELRRSDVARRLAELAFGKCNDCVKLAMGNGENISKLDLGMLTEFKRSEKGAVEVKLVDRLKALELRHEFLPKTAHRTDLVDARQPKCQI